MTKNYDIIGVGNAIVDLVCLVDDEFLLQNNLQKGGMFLIDETQAEELSKLKYEKINSGGSVANSVATLSMLGSSSMLIGKVGSDRFGDLFFDDLKKINCDFICKKREKSNSTAKSFILITPDGERTMCTFLGLASKIADEITEDHIQNSKILYLEGYLWDAPETIAALRSAIVIAKKNQIKIAFTLSDAFCVTRHKKDFLNLISQIDILFANEDEMKALIENFEADDYKKMKDQIFNQNQNLLVVMTRSENGVVVFSKNDEKIILTKRVDKVVDATGAGDAFAAGFLYGLINDFTLEESANLGNKIAGLVITQIGARLNKDQLTNLKKHD